MQIRDILYFRSWYFSEKLWYAHLIICLHPSLQQMPFGYLVRNCIVFDNQFIVK